MAGIRQHVLPKLLLRGFGSRTKGKEVYTWVNRAGGVPFETNIINVSVEKNFYDDETGSVDAGITDYESNFGILLDTLRKTEETGPIGDPRIPEFIAHLCIRTKHLRESFLGSIEFLAGQFNTYLSDFDNLKRLIRTRPKMLRKELNKSFPNNRLSQREQMRLMINAMEQSRSEMLSLSKVYMAALLAGLPGASKKGQIKALAGGIVPEVRAKTYSIFNWFVCRSDRALILGDMGTLFEIEGPRQFKSIDGKDDKITRIFLPFSASRLLVGTKPTTIPECDFANINRLTAKCSREYFISSKLDSEISELIPSIGGDAELLTKQELERIILNLIH